MRGLTSRYVDVGGIWLHYADWGGDGPPLLFVHGDMRTSRSWDAVARDLRHRFRVLAVDCRGSGDSTWTDSGYRFSDRISDLSGFCDAIRLRDAVVVAHSTGGVVTTLVAHRSPGLFSRLVLLEPMIVVDEAFQRRVSRVDSPPRPRRTWPSRPQMLDFLTRHRAAGRWRADVIRDVVEFETMELPDGSIDMKWAQVSMAWEERDGDYVDLRPAFREMGMPMLYIVSVERKKGYPILDELEAEIPEFHVLAVNDTSHNMYMERPDAVSNAILEFTAGRELPPVV